MRICCFSRSTAEADPGLSAPNDSIPQQQGIDKGTKSTSFDHISAGTNPHVLSDQTKSVSEGFETVLTQPITGKGASSIARQVEEDKASRTIKLEVLEKLVSHVQPSFKDLDSPEDDHIIVVNDSDKDEEADKDESFQHSPILLSLKALNWNLRRTKLEAEAALLRAQPSFPNMGQLNELLVNSLQTKFSKILSAHDFSSSLPTELKEPPSKFNELTKELKGLKKQVHNLEIQLLGELKEIPTKLEDFTKTVTSLTSQVTELKILQWELPAEFLSMPTHDEAIASKKTKDASVPLPGQAGTQPAEGEKNINQATILVILEKLQDANLTKQQSKNKPTPTTPIIPPVITTTTTQMQSPFSKIEEEAKDEAAKPKSEVRKEELVDLLGPEVVNKRHQGPGLDDHAMTFSSLLLAKVDKRNLNLLKQMRTIKQLRQ
ncbi:hypothetical protein Tco_1553804 [Tanacetum coccineum]